METPPPRPRRRRRSGWSLRLTPGGVILLMTVNIVVLAVLSWPLVQARVFLPATSLPSATRQPVSATPTQQPTSIPTPTLQPPSPTPLPPPPFPASSESGGGLSEGGMVVLSLDEGAHAHLFAYYPGKMPLTRLSSGVWDDITPALSPDGKRVAFASNRNGYWDLYLLDLASAQISRLTDSPDYDGAPCWSPDGVWIVHESYVTADGGGLEIFIRPIDGEQEPIRLTDHPAADYAPAWSPKGRQIAFVSTRSGEPEIWLADLDRADNDRFINLSRLGEAVDGHPAWSPDGQTLAWASAKEGFHNLYAWKVGSSEKPRIVGSGDWPVWSPDSKVLLTALFAPNQSYLTAYYVDTPDLAVPPLALPGALEGLSWSEVAQGSSLPQAFSQAAEVTPFPLWQPALTPVAGMPGGRFQVVHLDDVEAPYPMLHDMVDESYQALRDRVARQTGWDLLSTLENAFIPLTSSLDPGMGGDWLYTGRAFALTPLPLNAGWMAVVREDFVPYTYWHVYLRVFSQDGSAGMPLHDQPWDFDARYTGDPLAYERGGMLSEVIPSGYWVDFTRLAANYGWERLPALTTWQYSYPAARFNEFALTDGLSWRAAMLEVYPPEALVTPTIFLPPTRTPTATSRFFQSPTPTETVTPRPTLTPISPSLTPVPTGTFTATPTRTLSRSATSTPTRTPTP